jgi:hypothetical protein
VGDDLRERGCIAYVVGERSDTIEAILPHLLASDEVAAIGELVGTWHADNSDAVLGRGPA